MALKECKGCKVGRGLAECTGTELIGMPRGPLLVIRGRELSHRVLTMHRDVVKARAGSSQLVAQGDYFKKSLVVN